jgi:hypothetical protein
MAATMSKTKTDSYTSMVVDAIQDKIGGRVLTCPVSLDSEWEVQEYRGVLLATKQSDDLQPLTEMNVSFPLAVLVCETCGYSMMFNLFSLGVADELGLPKV